LNYLLIFTYIMNTIIVLGIEIDSVPKSSNERNFYNHSVLELNPSSWGEIMRRKLVILMVLFSIFLAIGCTGKGKTVDVRIHNSAFYPDSITISLGDTVKWTNLDSTPHTVIGTDFSSGNISNEASYEYTFIKAGTYNYYCSIDPSMKSVVIVK